MAGINSVTPFFDGSKATAYAANGISENANDFDNAFPLIARGNLMSKQSHEPNIFWSGHALKRAQARGISRKAAELAVKTGCSHATGSGDQILHFRMRHESKRAGLNRLAPAWRDIVVVATTTRKRHLLIITVYRENPPRAASNRRRTAEPSEDTVLTLTPLPEPAWN